MAAGMFLKGKRHTQIFQPLCQDTRPVMQGVFVPLTHIQVEQFQPLQSLGVIGDQPDRIEL